MKLLTCSCALVLLASSAHAQLVVPFAQDRSVSGTAILSGAETLSDSVSDSATDFLPFNAAESVTLDNGLALGSAGGELDTAIAGSTITATGSTFVNGESYDTSWSGRAFAETRAIYQFTLTAKATYTILGEITALDHGDGVLTLDGSGGQIAAVSSINGPGIYPVDLAGVLEPGDYRFSVSALGSAFGENLAFDFGFAEFEATFQLTPLNENYCVAAANSAGPGARLALGGSQNISDDDFRIEATGAIPGGFGIVFYGPSRIQAPFGDGFRCVGAPTFRVQPPVQADASGTVSRPVSFTSGPAASGPGRIEAASTWNFQLWYRDPVGPGGGGFNLSDGLSVTFCD